MTFVPGFQNISDSLLFLKEVILKRLNHYFHKENGTPFSYPALNIPQDATPFTRFLDSHQMSIEEFIIITLALVPHIQSNFLDAIIQGFLPSGDEFMEFGGVKGTGHRGTLPTGETVLFILAGNDLSKRMQATAYFSPDHFFAKENIVQLEEAKDGEPRMSGKIVLQPEYVDLFTMGIISKPIFGPDFPAKHITTGMNWEDLVLNPKTSQQIEDIQIWLNHNTVFMNDWEMNKRIKPGFRTLFYGPPGTGKTLTATLLGNQFQKDVYRIDLSQVVSKYIGETEKNLEKVFNKAENKNWIIFFDEADALFGKRSGVQSAHDKYANQEVSYLLQRVEDFPGLIILASNYKSNIDQAFVRRFNSIIQFPMPNATERAEIWKRAIPSKASLAINVDLTSIAAKYELSGSAIVSVIHYASLQTIHHKQTSIPVKYIVEGIKKEYEKEEKVFPG